ncbi:MAG: uroporphyrinogen-III C-methyltransferase [Candidatus Methanospirareceae archaeon]
MEKRGKVYLVGAGPGDYELMTLKAKRVLEEADVVLYDRLVGEEILEALPRGAELIDVGKAISEVAKEERTSQSEINEIMERYAREGKKVVRLKGGDPFLFGRGGEEVEFLASRGIEFEVVPGVTSALAVPASVGIPVTHRAYSSTVIIATGHLAEGKDEEGDVGVEWEKIAKIEGTLIILMGVKNLGKIASKLIESGKDPKTGVAVIERGTTKYQRVITATLDKIAEEAERVGVKPPAVIVIGDVVRFYGMRDYGKEGGA